MSSDDHSDRTPRRLGSGAATSLFFHLALLFPLVTLAFILGNREEAQRAEEMDVTFDSVPPEELPADLPPIEDTPAPKTPKTPKTKEALAVKPEPKPPDPDKPVPPEKPPEQQPPPKQPPPEKINKKVVDFDIQKEDKPADDAKYLAEKSHRTDQETRAERTNLEKEQKGGEASSSPNKNQSKDIGDDKDKIAKLQDQKSKKGREAPAVTPHQEESLQSSDNEERKSLLSLRNNVPRVHEISPQTLDLSLPRDDQGIRAMPEENLQSMKDMPGRSGAAAKMSMRLTGKQYHYLFGDDAAAAEQFASKQRSKKKGRFEAHNDLINSALENFIPEVKPGNQTELNTRAAPFAAFIARMHRSIHELWGFGFLVDLDGKSSSDPLNNRSLVSTLEIVLNGDGTIAKVGVIGSSGLVSFDAAAVDTVYSAGPYPDPPHAIRSRNGKIYVHWQFHRDERQCATSGVDYFILDNAPAGGDTTGEGAAPSGPGRPSAPGGDNTPGPSQPNDRELRRLERGLDRRPVAPGGSAHAQQEPAMEDPAVQATTPMSTSASSSPGASEPTLAAAAPARTPLTQAPPVDSEATRQVDRVRVHPEDPAARGVAERWFDAYAQGDVGRMVQQAMFPFKSREGIAARSSGELHLMLREIVNEAPATRSLRALQLYSASGMQRLFGGVPSSFGDDKRLLFAVAHVGGDTFVLVLSQQSGQWRASGLVRG